jgi:TetR/AcrR family transcriptional repressor of nem operon
MPRTKQFDEDVVLERAMNLFWSRGFEATSMQALVDNMGINRGSLYGTFEDKRTLFERALERYDGAYRRDRFDRLETRYRPRRALEVFLAQVIDESIEDEERRGCFIVNTALELAPHDPEIAAYVEQVRKEIVDSLTRIIRRGQESGEIRSSEEAQTLARTLLTVAFGLRVWARIAPRRKEMEQTMRAALALLG